MSKAIIKAMEERLRQINSEGFTATHDDNHTYGEIAVAAAAYANHSVFQQNHPELVGQSLPANWPWHLAWWKPSEDPQRNIIKAMALLAAEYDRIERAEAVMDNSDPEPAWSNNGEVFYDEISDVITDHQPGDTILIGDTRRFSGSDFTRNTTEEVIERMQESAYEEMGEFAETYLEDIERDQEHPARLVLDAFIDAWADHYGTPSFWGVDKVRDYIVTDEDVEAARNA